MDVIYPRCAGLDVHKQTVVACARIAGNGAPLQEVLKHPAEILWSFPKTVIPALSTVIPA